jgi:hypothetical protein
LPNTICGNGNCLKDKGEDHDKLYKEIALQMMNCNLKTNKILNPVKPFDLVGFKINKHGFYNPFTTARKHFSILAICKVLNAR